MQPIQINLKFIQENLSAFSFCISLLALIATWGNFWNSRRVFLASNYPKIKANLYLPNRYTLPVYNVRNESDKITANDLRIEVGIRRCLEFTVFRGMWFTYTVEKLTRLKPLESFVPSGMSSGDLIQWLTERGHEPAPPVSVEDQKIHSRISIKKSYKVRLDVYYTSHVFGANKICMISKKYKLISCSNSEAIDSRDEFFWKLVE
ncbi:hypothetical protein IQ244_09825 [Nostoc sp. LEGE 06077]|uniref:hypothetical protein n=1 Tax=Nostoc sp. LEGE 06077 TaxID=915325 RepID=UPI001881BA6A|nr:hypothetical protein [Nostoc sp. LEGE 06077]MBE9206808.1 hypothetical protein [Nostoc sp. LEGE 06077]